MRVRTLRRFAIGVAAAAGLVGGSLWAIPGDAFGERRVLQKGQDPQILVWESRGSGGPDMAYYFRLDYVPGADCFVSEFPGANAGEARKPIIWPPGTRVLRDGDRVWVSVPKGGMIWSSFTRTTFWDGDIIEGSGLLYPAELTEPLPVLPEECFGTLRAPEDFESLDEAHPAGYYPHLRNPARTEELDGRPPQM